MARTMGRLRNIINEVFMRLGAVERGLLFATLALALVAGFSGVMGSVADLIDQEVIRPEKFRLSPNTGLGVLRLQQTKKETPRWNMSLGLWVDGKPVREAQGVWELEKIMKEPDGQAFSLLAPNRLYVTPALLAAMKLERPRSVILGQDVRVRWRYVARMAGGGFFLVALLGILRVAHKRGGETPQLSLLAAQATVRRKGDEVALLQNVSSKPDEGGRLVALDSLRGIAAMAVVAMHYIVGMTKSEWVYYHFKEGELLRTAWLAEVVKLSPLSVLIDGQLMVHVFWVLSGLVLALPFLKSGSLDRMGESAAKRYFRLMPLPFFSTLLSFVLAMAGAGALVEAYCVATGFATNLGGQVPADASLSHAFVAAVFLDPSYNLPLWTIGKELLGSLVLFGIVATTLGLARRRLIWIALGALFAMRVQHDFLVDFMVGLLLAEFMVRGASGTGSLAPLKLSPGRAWALLGAAVLIGTALPGWLSPWVGEVSGILRNSLDMVAAAGLVAVAAFSQGAARVLSAKPLRWLGERSFAIYVMHTVVERTAGPLIVLVLLKMGLGVPLGVTLGILLTVVVTLLVADWVTRWVDEPSVALARKVGKAFKGGQP